MSAPDVLLVDDESDLAEVTSMVLEAGGYRVRVAANGNEGLARLAEGLPDLVVLDVEMPQLSGPAMAHRMFVENTGKERVPIVLVSGCVDLSATARRVGTPYVLAKPFSPAQLLATCARALEERRAPVPADPG